MYVLELRHTLFYFDYPKPQSQATTNREKLEKKPLSVCVCGD